MFKDHFSGHAAGYAAHRPAYPDALIDCLADLAPGHGLALDCACGSGQLSVPLARRFQQVVATDASAAQIAAAEPHPRIRYRTAPAERSGLADASADLVAVAQAAHWLDLRAFYAEARRVARPGALLALISYGLLSIDDAAEADALVLRFHDETLAPWWPPERAHVTEGYRSLPFPFAEVAAPRLAITLEWQLADLVGYLDSWSAIRAMEAAVGRAPFASFCAALAESWGDPQARRSVRWPLALRLGQLRAG